MEPMGLENQFYSCLLFAIPQETSEVRSVKAASLRGTFPLVMNIQQKKTT